jgi:Domain of unknown function (DUF6894)
MPRFYFHLKNASQSVPDEDGSELPHAEAAYLYAFECAQELWGVLLENGNDPTAYTLEVVDGDGNLLFVLPLTEVLDAVRKQPPRPPTPGRETMDLLLSRNRELRRSMAQEIAAARERINDVSRLLRELLAQQPSNHSNH